MIKLTGKDASNYLEHELKDLDAKAFEITDANDQKVQEYFDKIMSDGRDLTNEEAKEFDSKMKYGNSSDAKVVDTYNIFSNNCTRLPRDCIAWFNV